MVLRNTIGFLAGCAFLASPALAQEQFDASAAWTMFADTCKKIIAAPEGAIIFGLIDGWEADVAATEDGWGILGLITVFPTGNDAIESMYFNFGSDRYPDGTSTYCTLQINGPLPGIFKVAASNVGDLLGTTYETFGGTLRGGETANAKAVAYRVPGFPPDQVVRIQQFDDRLVTLNITRLRARAEN